MSIFIDISSCAAKGGIGRYVREIIKTSPSETTFVSRKPVQDDIKKLLNHSQRLISFKNISRPYWEFSKLPALLKEEEPSMSAFWGPDWTLPRFNFKCPVFLTVHDPVPWLFPEDLSLKARFWFRLRTPESVSISSLVFSDSEWSCMELKKIFPEKDFLAIYPISNIKKSWKSNRYQKKEKPSSPKLLYLGAISPRKRLRVLLDAFSILKKRGYSMRWIGYRGKGSSVILEKAKRLGVEWLEDCPESILKKSMKDSHCLIYPSKIEGFGLPVVEGMLAGIPVCTLDTKVSREVGRDAVEYFTEDTESLIASVEKSIGSNNKEIKNQLWKLSEKSIEEAFFQISKRVNS